MEWTGLNELREKFLSFFESKGHLRLPSFPLMPSADVNGLLISFPDNFKIRMHHAELFPIRFHAPVYNHRLPGAQHPGYARHAEPQAGKTGLPQKMCIRDRNRSAG